MCLFSNYETNKQINEKKVFWGINLRSKVDIRQTRQRKSVYTNLPPNVEIPVLGSGQPGQRRAVPTEWS